MLYYAGLNICRLQFLNGGNERRVIDEFSEIINHNITDLTIGWNYFLLWQGNNVYLYGIDGIVKRYVLLKIFDNYSPGFKCGTVGKDAITLLTIDHELWQFELYENSWKKIDNFIPSNDSGIKEYVVKIVRNQTIVALSNLGRVFNIPTLIEMPKQIKFVDIVCGFEHTVLLTDNGDVYSMGTGSRGQLGHGDLEDCHEPILIEALAGLKIVQISAAGWHSAAITSEGDLYAWGWNTNGELGVTGESKVFSIPTIVDFPSGCDNNSEVKIKKVQCGNTFTICISDNHLIWGCGSNKYGQLGQCRWNLPHTNKFIKLQNNLNKIVDVKCQEWGTIVKTS